MDTIACRRDPNDKNSMVCVLDWCPKLNQVEMKEESEWCIKKFDSHDEMNDKQAKKFPLNSLESSLQKEIDDKSDDTDTFVDSLFCLIEEERPATMNAEDALIDTIKAMSPSQHPNENVKSHVSKV